jgi:hypothetical protein
MEDFLLAEDFVQAEKQTVLQDPGSRLCRSSAGDYVDVMWSGADQN